MVTVTTKDRVLKVIADCMGLDEEMIMENQTLNEDLGFDSLDRLDLIFKLDQEFGKINLEANVFQNKYRTRTVSDLIKTVEFELQIRDSQVSACKLTI